MQQNWREKLREWRKPLFVVGLIAAAVAALHESNLRDSIENYTARYLESYARRSAGLAPATTSSLKVLSFDDTMMAWYGDSELSRKDWAILFDALKAQGVKNIVVDKIFGLAPRGEGEGEDPLIQSLKDGAPVIAASFFSENAIKGRAPLTPRPGRVQLSADADWVPYREKRAFYGPNKDYEPFFPQIGHIVYSGNGYIEPVHKLSPDIAIAHSGMMIAKDIVADKNGLSLDGQRVPLDRHHRLLVNLPDIAKVPNYSLKGPLALARAGKRIPVIDTGDTVVILPLMFTGNTDFKETASGRLAGGYFIVAMVNSVLSGNWLHYFDTGVPGLVFAAYLAGFMGLALPSLPFAGGLLLASAGITAGGLALFAKLGYVTDWSFLLFSFDLAALATFIYKSRRHEKQARRAREALSGLVPEQRLAEIINDPSLVRFEPSEKVLTLMFIDIVGFSTVAETKTPQQVFADLKEAIGRITRIVHEYDGFVDRTLGDGLLCYFGYAAGNSSTKDLAGKDNPKIRLNHAEQAISCAMAIQKASIEMTLASEGSDKPVFPLRIGINTAGVFLGDLGDGRRLDYTVIGHGVNFSQRLESSCEPYRVMVSGTTYALATKLGFRDRLMRKRLIQIKHHKEYFEVFELIPLEGPQDVLTQAQSIFNKSIGMNRTDQRWDVPKGATVRMGSEHGVGDLVNYSRQGFSIKLPSYLARGFQTTFQFQDLREGHHLELGSIHGEVRWGRPLADGSYLHGVLIKNLSEMDTDIFLHQLHAICRKRRPKEVVAADHEPDVLTDKAG
jgi:class 3 adenylate cyclase